MKIQSIYDPAFRAYGQIVEGYDTAPMLEVLSTQTPLPSGVVYEPSFAALEALAVAKALENGFWGGMPMQLGFCNGHNTQLNCLEYHRDSELNLGTEDFILLVALRADIEASTLDTSKVAAFLCPAGVLIEVYATTLHYAPCETAPACGFRVLIGLPRGTNTPCSVCAPANTEDKLLWAKNKWLLAHSTATEATQGAHIGLVGENINVSFL